MVNRAIQLDAWIAKKFLVLIKRKLSRQQIPRNGLFRKLLGSVFPNVSSSDGEQSDGENPSSQACFPIHYDLFIFKSSLTMVVFLVNILMFREGAQNLSQTNWGRSDIYGYQEKHMFFPHLSGEGC